MILKNNFLFFLFTFSGFSLFAMEVIEEKKSQCHIVFSCTPYEDATRKSYPDLKIMQDAHPVMTFAEKKMGDSPSGKTFAVGDDGTTFYNSSAMKFAGLGDSMSVASYSDAGERWYNVIPKMKLYGKSSVIALAEHLYKRVVVEKRDKILLIGPCVGASIMIECAKKLVTFEQDPDYFEGTSITQDASKAIIAAINNGGFVAMVPLMSIKKHNAVALPAALLSGLTLTAVTAALYHCAGPAMAQHSTTVQAGLLGAGLLTYSALEDCVKSAYASAIKYTIVPLLSRFHYNPFHEDPIDNIECLQGKITGTVALNFTEKDWVMQWKDADLFRLHNALNWQKFNARVVITHDTGHMEISPVFKQYLHDRFVEGKSVYFNKDKDVLLAVDRKTTAKIYPWGIFSRLFALKKLAFGIMFICLAPVLMKLMRR